MRRRFIWLTLPLIAVLSLVLALPRSTVTAQDDPWYTPGGGGGGGGATYSIWNVEYAFLPVFSFSGLGAGIRNNWGNLSGPMNITLIKGNGRTIVFDAGFENPKWVQAFVVTPH